MPPGTWKLRVFFYRMKKNNMTNLKKAVIKLFDGQQRTEFFISSLIRAFYHTWNSLDAQAWDHQETRSKTKYSMFN